MYHFIEDKEFLGKMRKVCSDIVNQLVQEINKGDLLNVKAYLVEVELEILSHKMLIIL